MDGRMMSDAFAEQPFAKETFATDLHSGQGVGGALKGLHVVYTLLYTYIHIYIYIDCSMLAVYHHARPYSAVLC